MRVYSKNFVFLYDIADSIEALIDSVYVGDGNLTLKLPISHDAVFFIEEDGWLVTDDEEPFIVKVVDQGESEATYTAYSGHKYISQRVGKKAYLFKTGSADAVVKYFVDQLKSDLFITTAPVQSGPSISEQIRLTNLGDKVADILTSAGRGERYTLSASGLTFDTYAGMDRSVGNEDDNPSVVFALKYGNIDEPKYTRDGTKRQTTVYVAGAGEGEEREVYVLGDEATGVDRVEVVVDARDVDPGDTATLAERAAQSLIDDTISISAAAIADSNLKYGVDYNLGDIVTIKIPVKSYQQNGDYYDRAESTINVNRRLVEVVKSYSNGSLDIDLVFGTLAKNATTVLKKEVAQLKSTEPEGILPRGGTTGQILRKSADGDFATEWVSTSKYVPRGIYNPANGILIQTDIAETQWAMFRLVISGNGYGSGKNLHIEVEGYNYPSNNQIINTHAIALDLNVNINAFIYNGYLYFWLPKPWGYSSVYAEVSWTNSDMAFRRNHVTSITDAAKPTAITRDVTITPAQIWNSVNRPRGAVAVTGDATSAAFWRSLEPGTYWNNGGSMANAPYVYGFAVLEKAGGDFSVTFYTQSVGSVYRTSGNHATVTCAWRELFDSANIESGENANGRYYKYPDGTMICTARFYWSSITLNGTDVPGVRYCWVGTNYAATFSGNGGYPRIALTGNFIGYMGFIGQFYAYLTNVDCTPCIVGTTNQTIAFDLGYIAIGRWK